MSDLENSLRVTKSEDLRWECDTKLLDFQTTTDLDPTGNVLGQTTAQEALEFGIRCLSPGQNVFVRGQRGTGRSRMVQHLIKTLAPNTDGLKDYCYVYNFDRADRPRLIRLAAGTAPKFRELMLELGDYVNDGLGKALDSEPWLSQRQAIQERVQQTIRDLTRPLEDKLQESQMALVTPNQGSIAQGMIFPVVDGQPVPPDQLKILIAQEKADPKQLVDYEEKHPPFQKELQEISRNINDIVRDAGDELKEVVQAAAKTLLAGYTDPVLETFDEPVVKTHIQQIIKDLTENQLQSDSDSRPDFKELYGVNILVSHTDLETRPVVQECTPNLINLLGTVEPEVGPEGATSDFRGVRAGSLLMADQGYLILDTNDLLSEPGAYKSLMRTLRTGLLEIVPPEMGWMRQQVITQPEPIKIDVRVILIGDAPTWYHLDSADPDFRELFKVLADFDSEMPRDANGVKQYASVLAQLCKDESLPAFHFEAVAALVEHGARIVARPEKLTARLGRIADIAREAAFLGGGEIVQAENVKQAVKRTKNRASLPSRKFQEMVERGTLIVKTSGEQVGQINGLAVMRSGPLTYGFPARITTTISPGTAGLINIEGQASMSGSIHTKGFQILGGLLRHLLVPEHPLAFSASIAFEQSYGGIDGDSASGAEMVCLLSALTDTPIGQNMAMTGAIDQHGNVEAIGGVNEKIEGFFDACNHFGLTGNQGVIIPKSNAGDLMLREDVVEQCMQGNFSVWPVERIEQAVELMTGIEAGELNSSGQYPEHSVLGQAVSKARDYWRMSLSSPAKLAEMVDLASEDVDPRGQREDENRIG